MKLQSSVPLPTVVANKYNEAQSRGSLTFSPTELTTIWTSSGIPFQLRYCPALAKKPRLDDNISDPANKPDPFLRPTPDLFIGNIISETSSHILVLNKYPVIAEHFILATKEDKPQTDLLERDDLQAIYLCMKEWEAGTDGEKRLFAFFNSGEHSGASQPHRHVQFLPIEHMKDGDEDGEWGILSDRISGRSRRYSAGAAAKDPSPQSELLFSYFGRPLPPEPTSEQLFSIYVTLLSEAAVATTAYFDSHETDLKRVPSSGMGAAPISYNMAMTTSSMVLCPRISEGGALKRDDGAEAGFVQVNGTILGGTLMVKEKGEFEALRGDTKILDGLLTAIGIPAGSSRGAEPGMRL